MDRSQGRTGGIVAGSESAPATFTGNRALQIEEPLIFEMGQPGRCGVDLPEPPKVKDRLNGLRRTGEIGLPGLSEPQVVQHYTRLSQKNYAIDMGVYPLGSCTMKHNPRINEKVARLAGIGDLHPLQPLSTVQGALELIDRLAHWLKTLTGMPAVAMSPAAGAHGERGGMMAIAAALEPRGERGHGKAALAPYAPYPWIVKDGEGWRVAEEGTKVDGSPVGRLKAFHGQMGMFTRARSFIMSHGADGLKQVTEDAVLSANYVMASLKDIMSPAFEGPCMHEALFDDSFLKDTGVSTLDFAKAMID